MCWRVGDGCDGAVDDDLVTQVQDGQGDWTTAATTCAAGGGAAPDPGLAVAVRDAFTKLVPQVGIGRAGQEGVSLVNVETLYWLDTPVTVDLGAAVLLGQRVDLLATVTSVRWDFGDGQSGTSQGPGRAFTSADLCGTPSCPGWFGHTYTVTTTQPLTVTATATWSGRYSVAGGPFAAIAGTVTAPVVTLPMQVRQAQSVLVPNPTTTD